MFDKIKSLFVEEINEETQKNKANKSRVASVKKEDKNTPSPKPTSSSTVPNSGQVTDKFMKILFTAMDKNNLEGFDYLEFKNSLNSLKKMPNMDEATRFQSAYAMAQTMGATPEKLMQTAQHYLDILTSEENKFEKALEANSQKQIGSKQNKMSQLATTIKSKEEQIKKLEAEINGHKEQQNILLNEVKTAATKIENTKANFIASYEAITTQIRKDMDRIKTYLS